MNILESSLYELTRVFLAPVLLLILAALAYAFLALGSFVMEACAAPAATARRWPHISASMAAPVTISSCGSCSAWNGCG
jgi:hypothetical protein